jgi:imidazolonepropionase-like amidohydrolase
MKKLICALLALCAYGVAADSSAVAIRNARIVPVSGPVIAKGTVVLRGGLIEAVGDVQPPADAWVVDGEGMTVYPGLVDALSTVGIPGAAPAAAAGGGRGGRGAATTAVAAAAQAAPATRSMGPEDRPQTTSWLVAADELQASDRRIETVRGGGITTAITFPTRGIFGGQGSAIDLAGAEKPGELVLDSPMGQYIAMGGGRGGGGGGGFPSSLMGVIAYVRQLFIDADYYKMVKDAYEKNPRGMARPEYDRALEGLLASKRILLPANRLVEMDRMIRFSAELKRPTILYGMHEAYRPEAVDLLKKANMPVLVSLKFPAPASAEGLEDEAERTLQTYDQAPSAAALLQKAGVKFAFYSDGLDAPRDIQRAVKKAIDAGLPREQALRAMTMTPAEIYGVADRVGSIEKGKIANLVVTKGDIFDTNTKIEMVFVDGKKYTPADTAAGAGRGAATEQNPGGNR